MQATDSPRDADVEFSRGVKEFLRDLIRSYPSIKEFKLMLAAYKIVKSFGKRHVFAAWSDVMNATMEDAVRNRDERLWMSPEFINLPSTYWMYDSYIPVFRSLWTNIDDHSKDAVWRHFEHLVTLAERCRTSRNKPTPA
jgi:hypothetical protein